MRISIDGNLLTLKNYLQNKGYEVIDASEGLVSDIYIYSESGSAFNQFKNSIPGDSGSFIINVDNLSLTEIEYALKHRTYTPIFD